MAAQSIKATLASIREAGMSGRWSAEWREFRVTFMPGEMTAERLEAVACYTPDPLDAIGSARAMRAQVIRPQHGEF